MQPHFSLRSYENLINCFLREIVFNRQDDLINYEIDYLKKKLTIKINSNSPRIASLMIEFESISLTGTVLLSRVPVIQIPHDPKYSEVDFDTFFSWMKSVLKFLGYGDPHSELMLLIADSHRVSTLIQENLGSGQFQNGFNFIDSEQSLVFGHPFHPSPKSRIGFSDREVISFSPETGAKTQLFFLDLPLEDVVGVFLRNEPKLDLNSLFSVFFDSNEMNQLTANRRVVYPMHPFQFKWVSQIPQVAKRFEEGRWRLLGTRGLNFFPTSSVRTFFNPDYSYFIKFALNVRITNCIRRYTLVEIQSSIAMTAFLRRARSLKHVALHFLDEIAGFSVNVSDSKSSEECFGFVLRENLNALDQNDLFLAASLFGDRQNGFDRLKLFFDESRTLVDFQHREFWFRKYSTVLIESIFSLFFDAGLMFEPHLQNVIVGRNKFVLRDYDNGKIVQEIFDHKIFDHEDLNFDVRTELTYTIEKAWERLIYCLLVNNFSEVCFYLSDGDRTRELNYWKIISQLLKSEIKKRKDNHFVDLIESLFRRPTLFGKANFLTRYIKVSDRDAPFCEVSNPLYEP